MTDTKRPTRKSPGRSTESAEGFTAEERAAIKEHAKEVKAARRRSGSAGKADAVADVLAKIAEMAGDDRVIAERVHEIITTTAPDLEPRTWYGMPAYAKDGKVIVFFQNAGKFKARYATLGFNDGASLDEGEMWATSFAVTRLTPEVEERIASLVRRAAG